MKTACLAVLASFTCPAAAQTPATRVDVELSSFKFTPAVITLQHGRAYLLHFTNTSSGGHDFVAKDFFATAKMTPTERRVLDKGGSVELSGGEQRDVRLIAPAAGRYTVHCSHFLHETFGMKGRIDVE